MLLEAVLAVSTTSLSFDEGHFSMSVPSTVQVKQQKVNFETAEYDLYEPGDTTSFLQIVDGGGAYDLLAFKDACLNGRQAWRDEDSDSGTVVVGEPGVNAVAAYWVHLSGQRLDEAKAIVSSIRIDWGHTCQ